MKGLVTANSKSKLGSSTFKFKGIRDYARGNRICTKFCLASGLFETATGGMVFIPIPGKILIGFALKGVLFLCQK